MNFLETIILGIVQGLTEFLPVSSSGHLAIAQNLLNISSPTFSFDLLLHLGTQVVVILYFGKRIVKLTKRIFKSARSAVSIIVPVLMVTAPVIITGLIFRDTIAMMFTSMGFIAVFYMVTAGLLISTKLLKTENLKMNWVKMPWYKALSIGVFQAISMLPGISRSGSTIIGGMYMGLKPAQAFEFSFLAGIISVSGASIVEFWRSKTTVGFGTAEILGAVVAAIVGYLVLILVAKTISRGKFWYFGFYCIAMAVLASYLALR